ncbi:MAG: hypothetical protein ABI824_07155 [Acidobacteriota bacterium]
MRNSDSAHEPNRGYSTPAAYGGRNPAKQGLGSRTQALPSAGSLPRNSATDTVVQYRSNTLRTFNLTRTSGVGDRTHEAKLKGSQVKAESDAPGRSAFGQQINGSPSLQIATPAQIASALIEDALTAADFPEHAEDAAAEASTFSSAASPSEPTNGSTTSDGPTLGQGLVLQILSSGEIGATPTAPTDATDNNAQGEPEQLTAPLASSDQSSPTGLAESGEGFLIVRRQARPHARPDQSNALMENPTLWQWMPNSSLPTNADAATDSLTASEMKPNMPDAASLSTLSVNAMSSHPVGSGELSQSSELTGTPTGSGGSAQAPIALTLNLIPIEPASGGELDASQTPTGAQISSASAAPAVCLAAANPDPASSVGRVIARGTLPFTAEMNLASNQRSSESKGLRSARSQAIEQPSSAHSKLTTSSANPRETLLASTAATSVFSEIGVSNSLSGNPRSLENGSDLPVAGAAKLSHMTVPCATGDSALQSADGANPQSDENATHAAERPQTTSLEFMSFALPHTEGSQQGTEGPGANSGSSAIRAAWVHSFPGSGATSEFTPLSARAEASVDPTLGEPTAASRLVEPPEKMFNPNAAITLRLDAPGQAAVSVVVGGRQGQIHVAVRTPHSVLRNSLREDLSSLVGSLEKAGFQAQSDALRHSPVALESSGRDRSTGLPSARVGTEAFARWGSSGWSPGTSPAGEIGGEKSHPNHHSQQGAGGNQQDRNSSNQDQQRQGPRRAKWLQAMQNQASQDRHLQQ